MRLAGLIDAVPALDEQAMDAARDVQARLTKSAGSLGRLEELAVQLAGIRRNPVPRLTDPAVIVMAGDHGVADEGVSAYPREVTAQMVGNFLAGGAAINVLARHADARVVVVDLGVAADLTDHPGLIRRSIARGTHNIACGPAMTQAQAIAAIEAGDGIVAGQAALGLDIVGTGDMGIGNTTVSAAVCAAITGHCPRGITGRGTGIDDAVLDHKIEVIERALAVNRADPHDPLDVLSKLGGFEIGGLAGVMLGAAARGIPTVIDGFISGAAALIACLLCPRIKDYLIASHLSAEPGHRAMLDHLGLRPLLDLGLRLGEGTGAVLGVSLAQASVRLAAEMATFDSAGVSERGSGM